MKTANGSGSHSYLINPTVGNPPLLQQGHKTEMAATIMATVHVGVRCIRNESKAIDLKKFRQIRLATVFEVKGGLLCKPFGLGSVAKLGRPPDRLLCSIKVVLQQHP